MKTVLMKLLYHCLAKSDLRYGVTVFGAANITLNKFLRTGSFKNY